jgi:hypothetical protein
MRKCNKCKQIKDEEEFNFSDKKNNIRRYSCKACQKKYTAAYNADPVNAARRREHARANKANWDVYKRDGKVWHIHLDDTEWGGEQRVRVARLAVLHRKNMRNGTEEPLCVS